MGFNSGFKGLRAWRNFLCTFPLSGWCCLQLVMLHRVLYCTCWSPNCLAQVGTYWHQPDKKCTEKNKKKKGVSQLPNSYVLSVRRSLHTEELQMEVKCIGLCSVRSTDSWQEFCLPILVKLTLILGSGMSKFCLKTSEKTVICRRRTWEENTECSKRLVVTICTASLNSTILRSAHTLYLCVLCGSEHKQPLFPYTTLTDWFL